MASRRSPVTILGEWAGSHASDHPEAAYAVARSAFIDTVGCILAGAGEDSTQRTIKSLSHWSGGACHAVSGVRTISPFAALINGVAAHALDFDDNDTPAASHPSAALVPALLALAEERKSSGREVLDAYIVGLEVMSRIGEAVNMTHYAMGWHATATLGSIGAAAACGRLVKLDGARMSNAISIATSRTGGFKSQFGTMTKHLHPGLAAQTGIQAAVLAEGGLTASDEVLDGAWSLLTLMASEKANGFGGLEGSLGAPLAIQQYGISAKRYPCCYYMARALDSVLILREEHGLQADDVVSIEVSMTDRNASVLRFPDPRNQGEARFSLPYCVATAMVHGRIGIEQFSAENLFRSDVREFMKRIETVTYPAAPDSGDLSRDEPDTVIIRLSNGKTVKRVTATIIGSAALPLSEVQLFEKFHDCVTRTISAPQALKLAESIKHFDRLTDVGAITSYF